LAKTAKVKSVTLTMEGNWKTGYLDSVYEDCTISFALAAPNGKGKIKLTTEADSCREEVACWMQKRINTALPEFKKAHVVMLSSSSGVKADANGNSGPSKPSCEGAGRLQISFDEWMRRTANAGAKLANHFEKRNKWLQTKAYKVILPAKYRSTKHAYYFVGSRWWIYSPHNLSLYLLLLRLGKFARIQKLRKNMRKQTLITAVKSIRLKSYGYNLLKDAPDWYTLTKNLKKIYRHHRNAEDCWETTKDYSEGVYDFLRGAASDDVAYKNYCKIKKGK